MEIQKEIEKYEDNNVKPCSKFPKTKKKIYTSESESESDDSSYEDLEMQKEYILKGGIKKKEKKFVQDFRRSFHLLDDGESTGRYMARQPLNAAKKCFTKLSKNKGNFKKIFEIVESTRGYPKKTFRYEGIKKKRDESLITERDGIEIIYDYQTKVKKI